MKQLLQNLKSGETYLAEGPRPAVGRNGVLIQAHCSLVSPGTERMLVNFGRGNLLQKARQQPEKVKQVLEKVKTDGLRPTLEAVQSKLDAPLPLGYSNVGVVLEVGREVTDLKPGDRVVSNGPHAEVVSVGRNLVAKIPDGVPDEDAAFTVLGAIALQGIRLAQPTLGETFAVMGLGLIGLLTVDLLLANGCRVIGFDLDPAKVELARRKGAEAHVISEGTDSVAFALEATGQVGVDGVLITASTSSNTVIAQSATMARKRGRLILVGVVGLQLNRSDFYEKELSFQVSCSYGPGRYDPAYEQQGQDYPLPYVRWTEQRNFEAILQLMASGRLEVRDYLTESVPFEAFGQVYDDLGARGKIASLLRYSGEVATGEAARTFKLGTTRAPEGKGIALVGAGNFVQMTLLPQLKQVGVPVQALVSSGGPMASHLARKYKIPVVSTDLDTVLKDPAIGAVIVATQHHLHARMVLQALQAGKAVFCEKPLCLNREELEQIEAFYAEGPESDTGKSKPSLVIGFNRRFSVFSKKVKSLLGDTPGPLQMIFTVNAGFVPANSWVQDPSKGGGRIIGEACHFIDLARYFAASPIVEVRMSALGKEPDQMTDNASITLRFANGSHATVHYFANGHKGFPKERVEIFQNGKVLQLDNFRRLTGFGYGKSKLLSGRQDKGHAAQFKAFHAHLNGAPPIIPLEEIFDVTSATLRSVKL